MLKLILLLLFLSLSNNLHAQPKWVWQDNFTQAEKQKLTTWIAHVDEGMTGLLGALPYNYKVNFHRYSNASGPVPWANTDKSWGRAVHFHVDTNFSAKRFKKDWTAPHELSHLLFPYLGRKSMWFAEGFASYLQYQILYTNKSMSWKQATDKLQERFSVARKYKEYKTMSLLELNEVVFQNRSFVGLYWGGAAYFMNVDKRLYDEKNSRFNDVLKIYMDCCIKRRYRNAEEMMRLFDDLSDSKIFTEVYQQSVKQKGFPNTKAALAWLKLNPPDRAK